MTIRVLEKNTPARKDKIFADFKTNMDIHPGSNDVQVVYDADAIKRSIINLVKTTVYERPFQPTIGTHINHLLFEQMDTQTLLFARQLIENTVKLHEPRARTVEVQLSAAPDENGVNITIIFSMLNSQAPVTLELLLTKVR